MRHLGEKYFHQPIDPTTGPVLRACLVNLAPDDCVIIIVVHHFFADAWAMRVIRAEIAALYAAFSADKPSPLPQLAMQPADYAIWQHEAFEALKARDLPYWQSLIGDLPPFELPPDLPPPETKSFDGIFRPFTLPAELLSQLRALAMRQDASLTMILLSALAIQLSRWSRRSDVVMLLPTANRAQPALAAMVSYGIAGVILFVELSDDPSLRALLGRMRKNMLDGLDHSEILARLEPIIRPSMNFSQAFANIISSSVNAPDLPEGPNIGAETTMLGMSRPNLRIPFPLGFEVTDTDAGPVVTVQYHGDVFEAATIERFIEGFNLLLDAFASSPERRMSEIALPEIRKRQAPPP